MTSEASDAPVPTGSLAVQATRSSLWSLAGQLAQTLIGLAAFVVLSRSLGPRDYGLLGMAATVQGFVGVVGDSGMVAAVLRSRVVDERVEATAFWIALAGATLLAALCGAAAPLLGWFYREPGVPPLSLALAGTFLLAAPARVATAKLQRTLDFRRTTAVNVTANAGALIAAWAIARSGGGAWALVAQTALTFALQSLLTVLAAPFAVHPRLFSRETARELAGFSSQMSGFSLAAVGARAADPLLAGRFLGTESVGILSMGIKLLVLPIQRICVAVSSVFLPTILRLEEARHAEAFLRAVRLTSVVTIPLTLGVYAIAPEIVALLPARWSVLSWPLRIYALGSLAEPLGWYALTSATARGKSAALLRSGLTLIPVGWCAALFGALSGSVLWLIAAWNVANLVGAALLLHTIWRDLGLRAKLLWRALLVPHVIGIAMVIAVRLALHGTGLAGQGPGALVGAAVGVALYVSLLLLFERAEALRFVSLVGRASGVIRPRS